MIITERLISREVKPLKNGATQIFTDLFIETTEWETAIKRKKAEAESHEERYHYYVSTGVIDEHTSNFCTLKKSFHNFTSTFDELIIAIKEYQKELIAILHQENTSPDKEAMLTTHENLSMYSKNYVLSVNDQLIEIGNKFDKVYFNNFDETYHPYL